jgi:hypothetical protein
MAHKL